MKLKDGFIIQDIDGIQFMVPSGIGPFHGIVRNNQTAAFIVNCLREETTEERIVDAMCREYDAPRDVIAADVKETLATLRRIGTLEEPSEG